MKKPLLSVIVPIYNVEQYLEQCIQSIVNQTYTELEIILVDDGSPDNCPLMCDLWAEKDKRIKVVHKINGGLSDARNAGMEFATGEYVAFLDSDDWIDESYYEILITEMLRNHCDIASGSYKIISSRASDEVLNIDSQVKIIGSYEAMEKLIDDSVINHVVWNKIYKRNLIKDIPFEKGKYHEDVFWSYQVIGKAEKIVVVDYKGYYYYQRPDSIMGTGFSLKRLDVVEAKINRLKYLEENYPDLYVKGKVALNFTCMHLGQQSLRASDKKIANATIEKLREVTKKYPLSFSEVKDKKLSNKVWLLLSKRALRFVCVLRNILRIGM